ncbi:MAG: D-2-hydroxyacid dehydrogenase [Planctomycetaceae bacterium]|nr:D-2-hydroxyacid dehydrogenase [Planctomycetaceae bacterium]
MKIVVLDGHVVNPGDISWEAIETQGDFSYYDLTPADKVVDRIGDAEAVFTHKVLMNDDVFAKVPSVKFVGVFSTGYNNIDTEAAKRRGIIVTNVPGYSTHSVVQMAFALLLEACLRVGHHSHTVHAGKWSRSPYFAYWDYPLIEIHGKTLGIVGFGQIGQAVAAVAQAFGMNVLVHNRTVRPEFASDRLRFVGLDELLAGSDFVTLHVQLVESNKGMIDAAAIRSMKDGAILINTARGPLVVEADVAAALASGKLAAYGADVATVEPIPADNPLLGQENAILTPHIAWAPRDARLRLMDISAKNLAAYREGKPINVVNP